MLGTTMDKLRKLHCARWVLQGLAPWVLLSGRVFAQERPPVPPVALPSAPSPSTPAAATTLAEQQELRIQQLEAMVRQLSQQVGALAPAAPARAVGTGGGLAEVTQPGATATPDFGNLATALEPSAPGGVTGPGQSLPPNPAPSNRFDSPTTLESKRAGVKFGPGFELRTGDDEYILQFHNLTQFEYRGYQQAGQNPVHDTFDFPRQWWMFSGRLTKPIAYFLSFANGFDSLSMLDVFLDFEYDPRLRLRAGRMKAPFTYEFFVEPVQGLIAPERSLFFNNFGLNRDLGLMPYGRLFNGTLDYAGGIFNGNRNGYLANVDSKSIAAFINWKPFANSKGSFLENLNVGGSVYGGYASNIPQPQTFRTIVPIAGNQILGVPFLTLNNNVREQGERTFWDLHVAYFYKQLAIIAEWQSGFQNYAINPNLASRTRLPVQSYYVQAGYFLTGETRSSVGIVKPLRPFDLRPGRFGLGAFEIQGRFNEMNIGNQVFTNGLADPNNWADNLHNVELGFNWHFTQYLKFYFAWQHSVFGDPVLFAPDGQRQLTSDLFLARIQLFF